MADSSSIDSIYGDVRVLRIEETPEGFQCLSDMCDTAHPAFFKTLTCNLVLQRFIRTLNEKPAEYDPLASGLLFPMPCNENFAFFLAYTHDKSMKGFEHGPFQPVEGVQTQDIQEVETDTDRLGLWLLDLSKANLKNKTEEISCRALSGTEFVVHTATLHPNENIQASFLTETDISADELIKRLLMGPFNKLCQSMALTAAMSEASVVVVPGVMQTLDIVLHLVLNKSSTEAFVPSRAPTAADKRFEQKCISVTGLDSHQLLDLEESLELMMYNMAPRNKDCEAILSDKEEQLRPARTPIENEQDYGSSFQHLYRTLEESLFRAAKTNLYHCLPVKSLYRVALQTADVKTRKDLRARLRRFVGVLYVAHYSYGAGKDLSIELQKLSEPSLFVIQKAMDSKGIQLWGYDSNAMFKPGLMFEQLNEASAHVDHLNELEGDQAYPYGMFRALSLKPSEWLDFLEKAPV